MMYWIAYMVYNLTKMNCFFFRFRTNFGLIAPTDAKDLSFPELEPQLVEKKSTVVDFCSDVLKQPFTRGDYKELLELVLLYLSDEGRDVEFSAFRRPGALHKARWMSKMIYSVKMDLLRDKIVSVLPKGSIFSSQQQQKIARFVKFVAFCYVPWWLTAPVPSTAPKNDLLLIESLMWYKNTDAICANAALKAFANHLWYLTEELVPLALFSSNVEHGTKQQIAQKMLQLDRRSCSKRFGCGFGKPNFPDISKAETMDLSVFVGEDSWSFFELMKVEAEFLSKSVCEWETDDQYLTAKEIVDNICVVNDAAERGVKLVSDFIGGAREEENLQNILQVVEADRRMVPNQRKRKPEKWYLKV